MIITVGGHDFTSAEDALELLDRESSLGGSVVGAVPDSWPGHWLPELCASAPQWVDALVSGLLERWEAADEPNRTAIGKTLQQTAFNTRDAFAGVLKLMARQPRDTRAALDLLNMAVNMVSEHAGDARFFSLIEDLLPSHPALVFILAKLNWDTARPLLAAQIRRCAPEEITQGAVGFPLVPGHTVEAVTICLELDPARRAAFAPHMQTALLIHGRRDKALGRLIRTHWPSLA